MRQVSKPRKKKGASKPYRSLHVSDLHLNNNLPHARPGNNGVTDRLHDQERLIYRIFETADQEKCEAIFVQGDLFDHSRIDAITLTTTIRALSKTPVDLFVIGGNHDGVNTRGERFAVEALSDVSGCHYMETGDPFEPREWLSFWPLEFAPLERNREMLASFRLKKHRVNTLLMHNSVVGCTHVGWKCEEGMGFDADELTSRFDHVLSGHFHDPQPFGSNGRFLGAPMHHRFDDMGRDAGYWIMDWFEDGRREEQFVDGDAPRFHQLDISDEDARQRFLTTHFVEDEPVRPGDFVKVRLTCTHAELVKEKAKAEQLVADMRAEAMRATWFHDPVYHHTNRIVDESGDVSKVVSPRGMVASYVSAPEVDTSGLDRKKLKALGRDIFDAVEGAADEATAVTSSNARLLSIEGEDFAGFREFKMKLAKQGLTFIAGDNRDTDAATSNGACKTGLFKAVGWGLYGQAIDKVVGDEVIHIGQKCARTKIKIRDGEDVYLITRERRKQSPKLFVERNDEPIKRSKADLQRLINGLMGADWEGFRNTAMYGQRDRDRFVYPTTKDADRKAILHRIIRTGVFELAHTEGKKRRLTTEKDLTKAQADVDRLSERIDDVDLDALQGRADGFDEKNREKVKALVEEARTLAARAKNAVPDVDAAALRLELDQAAEESRQLADAIVKAKADRKAARTAYQVASVDVTRLVTESKANASTLELLEGDQCPTCTADLAKGRAAAHKRALTARKVDLDAELATAREARQRAAQAEARADQAIERAEEREEELAERAQAIREELDSVDAGKRRAKELAAGARAKGDEAKAQKGTANPYLDDLEKARGKVRKLKRERKVAKTLVKGLTDDLAHLEFWVRGFGPSGVPSFALDAVMPFITERANHYLKTLSDGDITINFSTQRELKSTAGELRDEIGITWWIEGIEDYPPSGGQWKKMEIATNFALMDLVATREGSHVNILCMDECLDGLDGEGKQRVVDLLHQLRSERESIFVISHDAELSEVFERTLIVIKEDGVSRLEKAA